MTAFLFPDLIPTVMRRKRLLMISGVTGACLAFGASRILPLQYAGEANIVVDNRVISSTDSGGTGNNGNVLTQVDVLRSPGMIRRVAEKIGPEEGGLVPSWRLPPPLSDYIAEGRQALVDLWHSVNNTKLTYSQNDKIIDYIQKNLKVESGLGGGSLGDANGPQDKSSVISIKFVAGTPETAALVVNKLLQAYLDDIQAARNQQLEETDRWIAKQTAVYRQQIEDAEARVTDYVQNHNTPEVQGSQITALQLTKDRDRLVQAREELSKQEAALLSVKSRNGNVGAASIGDKTVQQLNDLDAKIAVQLGTLGQFDPRRGPLQAESNSIREKLSNERALVLASLTREVEIAKARVALLEQVVNDEVAAAQNSTISGTSQKQLMSDLDAKRQVLVTFMQQLGQLRINASQRPPVQVLFYAEPPHRPMRSFAMMSVIIGFLGGSVCAATIVLLRASVNLTINSADDMIKVSGLPVFGSLPDVKKPHGKLGVPLHTMPPVAETFRALWWKLRSQNEGAAILVTSSDIGEGKTTIALGLAHRFAADGFRVLLIDADLRRPRLSSMLDPDPHQNIESVINGTMSSEQAVVRIAEGLDCLLTHGNENPVKLLASKRFKTLVESSKAKYDLVILDSPPALHVADPVMLAKFCQHIVYVVQAGRLSNDLVTEAIGRFSDTERSKMFILLSRVRQTMLTERDYYSGYVKAMR